MFSKSFYFISIFLCVLNQCIGHEFENIIPHLTINKNSSQTSQSNITFPIEDNSMKTTNESNLDNINNFETTTQQNKNNEDQNINNEDQNVNNEDQNKNNDDQNIFNPLISSENITNENEKKKILDITAKLKIEFQKNVNNFVHNLKAEHHKGKYLIPSLLDAFQSNILRPIKDSIDKINIELSPNYNNNNYGGYYQENNRPVLQKLNEKKHNLLNRLGIGCCNYNYPYPY